MKFPRNIVEKLNQFADRDQIVAKVITRLSEKDISDGKCQNIGISMDKKGNVSFSEQVLPAVVGRYTKQNVTEKEIIRRDLPMISYDISFEAPNFGDESKGTHEVTWTKEKYQREIEPPKELQLRIKRINEKEPIFEIEVGKSFTKDDPDLFFAFNLLQDAVGSSDIYSVTEKVDYTVYEQVPWELFPPEKRDEFFVKIGELTSKHPEKKDVFDERSVFFKGLKKARFILGFGGTDSYWGALLSDDFVIFEHMSYGNAIYVLYGNWKELSQKSRTELLKMGVGEYDRILHKKGWQGQVRRHIRTKLGKDYLTQSVDTK
jgi:hypothetical protein